MPSMSVYIGGLGEDTQKEDLEREFGRFGNITKVWVTRNPPGFAFIDFENDDDANKAITEMNGATINGYKIRVDTSCGGIKRGQGHGRGDALRKAAVSTGGQASNVKAGEKKKKKDKSDKPSKAEKVEPKVEKVEPTKEVKSPPKPVVESPKVLHKLRNLKRTSLDKKRKPAEMDEDVKIDPEPLMPVPKKPRLDRPKKFRATGEKKKKKDKSDKPSKAEKVEPKVEKVEPTKEIKSPPKPVVESPKVLNKLKNLKRTSLDKKRKPAEMYEDVKIDPEPLMPVPKKPRLDRPKKFRATGLEKETPLPKNIKKNTPTVGKCAVAAAKSTLKLKTTPIDRITEKKIKPESLMAVKENANTKGIKLIAAKPCPTYVLHESTSFIDALMSQPVAPIKRKKKTPPKAAARTPPTPTSPIIAAPKLQFYKDTLEEKMSENKTEENKAEEPEKKEETEIQKTEDISENSPTIPEETFLMEVTEEGGHTPPSEEIVGNQPPDQESDFTDEVRPKAPFDPNNLRSILSHSKRRERKKTVTWMEDSNIKEVFYFEMDDTERVNVSRSSNFYDLKFIEMKREREAMEIDKRQAGYRVEVFRKWWQVPILLDLPPPLVVPGCQSQEKLRQQSTLQKINLTKKKIPDLPHEPDVEIVVQKEPKVAPLDEEFPKLAGGDVTDESGPSLRQEDDDIENFVKTTNQKMIKRMKSFIEYLDHEEEEDDEDSETSEIDAYASAICRRIVYIMNYLIQFATTE